MEEVEGEIVSAGARAESDRTLVRIEGRSVSVNGQLMQIHEVIPWIQSLKNPRERDRLFEETKTATMNMVDRFGGFQAQIQEASLDPQLLQEIGKTAEEIKDRNPAFAQMVHSYNCSQPKLEKMHRNWEELEQTDRIRDIRALEPIAYYSTVTFGPPFSRCFVKAHTPVDAERALNTALLERLHKYDDAKKKTGMNNKPKIVSADTKRALEIIDNNKGKAIEIPRCDRSYMEQKGLTMLPCGLLGPVNGRTTITVSKAYHDEEPLNTTKCTLLVENGKPNVKTRGVQRREKQKRGGSQKGGDDEGRILTKRRKVRSN
jgi:hypothetical protein